MNDEIRLLKLPENDYLDSYQSCYNHVQQAVDSHDISWKLIKACQRHIEGQKPIPQDELKKKGMSWAWNFNFGKARAKIEKATAESVANVSRSISLSYVTFRDFKESDKDDEILSYLEDPQRRGICAAALSAALIDTLLKENRLSGWLNDIEYPALAFGYCALVHDPKDWIPEPTHPLNIAFRPDSKAENIESWVVFSKMTSKDIYRRWVSAKNDNINMQLDPHGTRLALASSGWNLNALEAILVKAFRGKVDGIDRVEQWSQVIPAYEERSAYFIQNTDDINIAKIFIKELNGTISEIYIPWNNDFQRDKLESSQLQNEYSVDMILYKKNHGKYDQNKYINIIRDSGFAPNSKIQDYRGIAKYSVEDSIRYNRVRNSIGNKMTLVGSPMFEQGNSQLSDKFKITVSQGFVLLPSTASYNLVERQPNFNISEQVGYLRFEEGEYLRDTQQFDASVQGRLSSRPNRGEVETISSEVRATNTAKSNVKLRDYASVFLQIIKKISEVNLIASDVGYEGQKRFFANVKKYLKDIVKSDEDVKKIVKCIDSFVIEPVISDEQTIMMAMQMAETPFARNRFRRMILVSKGMPIEEVNLAIPLITDKFTMLQDDRIAAIENDMFWMSNEVVIQGTDDHIVHLESHLGKAQRVVDGFQQQKLSPQDAFKYLSNIMPHAVMHSEMLGSDPSTNELAQQYIEVIKQLNQSANQIRLVAERMMEAERRQQEQIQLDPKTQADIARDNAKVQADLARKDYIAENRTQQRERQMELSHEQKMREIELKNTTQQM